MSKKLKIEEKIGETLLRFNEIKLPEFNQNNISIELKPECRKFYAINAPDSGEKTHPPYRHRMTFTGTSFDGGQFNESVSLHHVSGWKVEL